MSLSTLRPALFKVWATIAPVVQAAKTYQGYAVSRAQQLELDVRDRDVMRPKITRKPVRWNHFTDINVGEILDTRVNADGSWDVHMGIDPSTAYGSKAIKWIKEGLLKGVSLKHWPNSTLKDPDPEEVSLCWEGARGPDSRLHYDSKSQQYTSDA